MDRTHESLRVIALAVLEVFRLLSRRWAAIVPLLLVAPALVLVLAGRTKWIPAPDVMYEERAAWEERGVALPSAATYARPAFGDAPGRPFLLERQLLFWAGGVEPMLSSLLLLYALALCVLALALGAAGAGEDGPDPEASPLLAIPAMGASRLVGELAGRLGVLFVYHALAWGVWAWLSVNLLASTSAVLVSFLWPVVLASLYVATGVLLRRVGRRAGALGVLLLAALPVGCLGKLAIHLVSDHLTASDHRWAGTVPLPSHPGLRVVFAHPAGHPWYMNNVLLLAVSTLLCLTLLVVEVRRSRRGDVL